MAQKKKKDKYQKRHYENTKKAGVARKSLSQKIFIVFSFIMLISMLLPSIASLFR